MLMKSHFTYTAYIHSIHTQHTYTAAHSESDPERRRFVAPSQYRTKILSNLRAYFEREADLPKFCSIKHARQTVARVCWLGILFLGEMLTATTMGYFSDEIPRAAVLALFIPLIISS